MNTFPSASGYTTQFGHPGRELTHFARGATATKTASVLHLALYDHMLPESMVHELQARFMSPTTTTTSTTMIRRSEDLHFYELSPSQNYHGRGGKSPTTAQLVRINAGTAVSSFRVESTYDASSHLRGDFYFHHGSFFDGNDTDMQI